MKRVLAMVLAVLLALSFPVMDPIPVNAAEGIVFTYNAANIAPGGTFDVRLNVTSNPTGFTYVALRLFANMYQNGFTINNVKKGELLGEGDTVDNGSKYYTTNVSCASKITGTGTLLIVNVTAPTMEKTYAVAPTVNLVYSGGTYAVDKTCVPGNLTVTKNISQDTVYTIAYSANGGSGAPASQTKKPGEKVTLSTKQPTLTGYEFQGWATSPSASTPNYLPGATYSADGNVTLYAVWKTNSYVITYNANGGTKAPNPTYKVYNQNAYITMDEPVRDGYNFAGWAKSATATTADYQANSVYSANESVTLYAVWKTNPIYTISYHANGGYGAPADQKKNYGKTIYLSTDVPSRSYYNFLGWSTNQSATTATYKPGAAYTTNADATMYAVWKGYTYKVEYKANGGTGTVGVQNFVYGTPKKLALNKFTRTGAEFLGWSTDSKANTVMYTDAQEVLNLTNVENETITLYAVWKIKSYPITFDANGGTGAPAAMAKQHDVDLTLTQQKPVRSGYTFAGWGTAANARVVEYKPGDVITENGARKLYALWTNNAYPYTDVMAGAMYANEVYFVYDHHAMTGKTSTTFEPDMTLTRSQFAALLYKLEGSPQYTVKKKPFSDTPLTSSSTKAIAWCKEHGVVNGYNDNTYRPQTLISRQQFAQMLYKYAVYKGYDVTVKNDQSYMACGDANSVSKTFAKSVNWAYENSLIGSGGKLKPTESARRYEVAIIIARFIRLYVK